MKKMFIMLLMVCAASALFAQTLTSSEKQSVLKKWQEEKMSHELYKLFAAKWEAPVFSNISASETMHMQHVKDLAITYNMENELSVETEGVFADKEVNKRYNEFKTSGEKSLVDALKAGAAIEESDILFLKKEIAGTTQAELKRTYRMLLQASQNHLRAFVRNMKQQGIVYTPVILDRQSFEQLMANRNKKQNQRCGRGSCCGN
ncbi:MAG TPA: DUF2202 domain-containing protein [Chitinophagaceae bacterium]